MSAGPFLQVRFKTVERKPYESSLIAGLNFGKTYRGYLIRYKFTKGMSFPPPAYGSLYFYEYIL